MSEPDDGKTGQLLPLAVAAPKLASLGVMSAESGDDTPFRSGKSQIIWAVIIVVGVVAGGVALAFL